MHPWRPQKHRWLLWRVEQLAYSDFLGSGYRFHKYSNGRTRLFWTRKAAQKRADLLNKHEPTGEQP